MKRFLFCTFTLAAAAVFMLNTPHGMAISGVTITPALQEVTLQAAATEATFTTSVTNNTSDVMHIALGAQDFTYYGEDGGVRFLDKNIVNDESGHGLAAALQFDQSVITVAPNQTVQVPVRIERANMLAAGGHYAAIAYRILSGDVVTGNSVGVKPTITSLVFLSTAGRGTQQLRLSGLPLGWLYTQLPNGVSVVLSNTGNTQTIARGMIELINTRGTIVSRGIMNADSGLILPGAGRLFTVTMKPITQDISWPGMYRVRVSYRHDGQAAYTTYQRSILYIPTIVGIGAGLMFLGIILLAWHWLTPLRSQHSIVRSYHRSAR
jgi:hypothetical protein